MEIFLQLLAELLFEGAFEASMYRRLPLWLRWILIILVSGAMFLIGGALIFGAIFAGKTSTVLVRILIGAVGILIFGYGIFLIIRFLRSLKE